MKTIKISIAVMAILVSGLANAQSDKYQRPGKKSTEAVAPAVSAPAASKDAKVTDKKADAKSEKVDIQQMESEYWQSKDTEFHVVQSRKYTKEKRPYANFEVGTLIELTSWSTIKLVVFSFS